MKAVNIWGRLDNTHLILSRSSQQTPFVLICTPLLQGYSILKHSFPSSTPRMTCVWAMVRLSVLSSVANTPFTLVLHRPGLICSCLGLDLGHDKGGRFVADGVENLFKFGFCNVRVFLMETNARISPSSLHSVPIMFQSDVRVGNVL